jgi:hypothetical protein
MAKKKKHQDLRSLRDLRNRKKLNDGTGWTKKFLEVKPDETCKDTCRHDDCDNR